jgi:hypothetical protein
LCILNYQKGWSKSISKLAAEQHNFSIKNIGATYHSGATLHGQQVLSVLFDLSILYRSTGGSEVKAYLGDTGHVMAW